MGLVSPMFAQWHMQCVREPLNTDVRKQRYMRQVNDALEDIWDAGGREFEQSIDMQTKPRQLKVAQVEDCQMTQRGFSKSAIRLKFRIEAGEECDEAAFHKSVKYFCLKIFDLKAKSEASQHICSLSSGSLLGIEPLSNIFRLWWTRGFLATFVHKRVSLFNPLADTDVLTPWLQAAALIVMSAEANNPSKLCEAIWLNLKKFMVPESRTPDQANIDRSKTLGRDFKGSLDRLDRYMDEASQACRVQLDSGTTDIPSEIELNLFDATLDVLQKGFEVLTLNKEIFDQWVKIVDGTDRNLKGAVLVTIAGGVALGATIYAGGLTAAALGPLGLIAIGAGLSIMHLLADRRAKNALHDKEAESKQIQSLYGTVQGYARWMMSDSKPATVHGDGIGTESQEMRDLSDQAAAAGRLPAYNLTDYLATVESERLALREAFAKMAREPSCAYMFED